ncbi:DUF58 domain-containing protein [Candidatus Sumerlaeota bacterium]|nr:DUF58 domain-containing protein [Candidatus Sumerlaeota bacterium]
MRLPIEGWCMVVTMLLIGMAALNTAAPLLYLVFAMMCAFFLLSGILAKNTLSRITITRNAPQVWVAQESLPVEIVLTNLKRTTSSHSLHVRDLFPGKVPAGAVFFARVPSRGGSVRQQYTLRFPRRGVHDLDMVEVGTRFPFGLIERAFRWSLPHQFLILPQTIPVDSVMEQAKSELGDFESQRKGQGSSLYGLRPYTPDLSARDIHWKISARRGNLIAREHESEDRRRATVVLDNRVPAEQREQVALTFEKAIILTASVIEWLCLHGHEVELRTASGIVSFGTGSVHLARCSRALAHLQMIDPDPSLGTQFLPAEPEVTRFMIQMGEAMDGKPGTFVLSVAALDGELSRALGEKPAREAAA